MKSLSPECGKSLAETRTLRATKYGYQSHVIPKALFITFVVPTFPVLHTLVLIVLFIFLREQSIPVGIRFTMSFRLAYHPSDRPRPLTSRPAAQLTAANLPQDDYRSSSMYYSTRTTNDTCSLGLDNLAQ